MGKINLRRVIVGGLLAGLVLNVGESILYLLILDQQMEAAMMALNLPPVAGNAMGAFVVLAFALGIAAVWVYAAIRTRFGPGIPTAVVAGVMVWFLAYLYPGASMMIMQIFPTQLTAVSLLWGLVEVVLATIAGGWAYSEG